METDLSVFVSPTSTSVTESAKLSIVRVFAAVSLSIPKSTDVAIGASLVFSTETEISCVAVSE